MIVIDDASPLVALALCECLGILDKLFNDIKVSRSVYEEVTISDKPKAEVLKKYLLEKVVDVDLSALVVDGVSLGKGELSSIALYRYLKADYLLIDEKAGRRVAKLNQIKVVGSLGVLIEAKKKGIILSVKSHIDILRSSHIYFSQDLLNYALRITNE